MNNSTNTPEGRICVRVAGGHGNHDKYSIGFIFKALTFLSHPENAYYSRAASISPKNFRYATDIEEAIFRGSAVNNIKALKLIKGEIYTHKNSSIVIWGEGDSEHYLNEHKDLYRGTGGYEDNYENFSLSTRDQKLELLSTIKEKLQLDLFYVYNLDIPHNLKAEKPTPVLHPERFKVGDIVVSLDRNVGSDGNENRGIGSMFKARSGASTYTLYYTTPQGIAASSNNKSSWRIATKDEIYAFSKGIRKISNMSVPSVKSSLKANDVVRIVHAVDGDTASWVSGMNPTLGEEVTISSVTVDGSIYCNNSVETEWRYHSRCFELITAYTKQQEININGDFDTDSNWAKDAGGTITNNGTLYGGDGNMDAHGTVNITGNTTSLPTDSFAYSIGTSIQGVGSSGYIADSFSTPIKEREETSVEIITLKTRK